MNERSRLPSRTHVVVTANACFNLVNFRRGLMSALRDAGYRVSVLAPHDDYSGQLEGQGYSVTHLPMDRRGMAPHREAGTLAASFRSVARLRPDAILSYTIKNNLYVGLAARRHGVPFLPNVTGLGTVFSDRSAMAQPVRRLYRAAFAKAPVVFFQNDEDCAQLVRHRVIPEARARILPGSGVDLGHFSMSPLPGRPGAPVFLLVARLLWEKGLGEFVEAARRVRRRHPGATFRLVGGLETRSKAAVPLETVQAWVAEGVVEWAGAVPDIRRELAAADCVVLPSYYREGTPRSLLEAAATGRPVVTTTMPGCRDVVRDGLTGLLVPPRDADALAEAIERIAAMPHDKRVDMGAAGRAHVTDRFDERIVHRAYLEALERSGVPARVTRIAT